MPPNMHANIFTESYTLTPFIIISRVYFMSLKATPLSALDSISRGDISINIPLQHANIFTESNTLTPFIIVSRVYFMSLKATPLLALDSIDRGDVSINIPLQSNLTCPQTCMQTFLQNRTLSHLSLSSAESIS